ncbi:unnamed protein product [Paramecium octaurelia]|uniref:ZZ-type domain-containing protein n=1 Tax=Paramecium octaurelia TaxID=43137 RepID=A0A8S1W769_PAROT|nr:unnamed protein product [Paramecium octaurelia]
MQLQVKCNDQSWTFRRPLSKLTMKKILKRLPYRISNLPNMFTFQYLDFDGDMIDVTCDADLQTIRECQFFNEVVTLYVQQAKQGGFKKEQVGHRRENRKDHIKEIVNQRVMELIPEITKQVKLSIAADDVQKQIETLSINNTTNVEVKDVKKVVHERVACDGCEMFPIVGTRYKCAVCKDFDLCEKCEDLGTHEHAMLKIRNPGQAPSIIITAIGDKPDLLQENNLRNYMNSAYQSFQSITQSTPVPFPLDISSIQKEQLQTPESIIYRSTNPIVVELCELLGVRPEVAETLLELFPNQGAKEIMEIIGDDVEYLNSLQRSTI